MRVLVACEFSGIVRDAFRRHGHDAWSCDIIQGTNNKHHHIRTDVIGLLQGNRHPEAFDFDDGRPLCWDLMIAFPPCTHLAVSGARWFDTKQKEQRKAIWFFKALADAGIPKIAIENPIGIMSTLYRKPDQIIQPWQFGHGETKATCLWLKRLPKLKPTRIVSGRRPRVHHESPGIVSGLTRSQRRSITYQGIAEAMAEQWGNL